LRDYLLDVAREHAPEYRESLAKFRESDKTTVAELLVLDEPQAERIRSFRVAATFPPRLLERPIDS
jgi:hypothetical protein